MKKLYFHELDDECCYHLDSILDYMKENEISELKIFEAKRETGSDYFYCKYYDCAAEKNGECGKMCDGYQPRNGKSGICRHTGYCYEQTDKWKMLINPDLSTILDNR